MPAMFNVKGLFFRQVMMFFLQTIHAVSSKGKNSVSFASTFS